jgi:hypothetical protein
MTRAPEILALFSTLQRLPDLPVKHGTGVYILCLRPQSELPGVTPAANGLLYVGMTMDDLSVRNHYTHADSGGSSPRRSLGAILRAKLSLDPLPRGRALSEKDATHYRFSDEGEKNLIDWMTLNLAASQIVVAGDVRRAEKDLISMLRPPLNLTNLSGWKNPQKASVLAARAECADIARKALRTKPSV